MTRSFSALLQRSAAILCVAAGVAVVGLHGPAQAAEKLKVALLVESVANDGSFNQFAYDAAKKLADEGEITLELRERMIDPNNSEPVIRYYASHNYDLILGHGIDLSDPILKVAKDFPKIHFSCSAGPDLAGRIISNVDGWTYDFGQQGYLAGWVAGHVAGVHMVGMVGGPKLPFLEASHSGFRAGLKETNPDAKTVETFTGSWDDAQLASEATRSAASQGAELVWTSGDGIQNGVASAAVALGNIRTLGVTSDAGGMRDKVNIASVVLNMYPIYKDYLADIRAGKFGHKFVTAALGNKGLILTKINNIGSGIPADLQTQVDGLVAELASGKKQLPDFFAK